MNCSMLEHSRDQCCCCCFFFFFILCIYSAGMGMANLVISLVIRLVITYLGLPGNDLNLKERLFISI